jgi:hypothetical protein
MMSDPTYSFVYDRQSADQAFHGIAPRELMLSILAGLTPQPPWDGCLVYQGDSPLEGATVCIGTRGPGANDVQLGILEGFERLGVQVVEVYEGGPDVTEPIARARDGRWSTP